MNADDFVRLEQMGIHTFKDVSQAIDRLTAAVADLGQKVERGAKGQMAAIVHNPYELSTGKNTTPDTDAIRLASKLWASTEKEPNK